MFGMLTRLAVDAGLACYLIKTQEPYSTPFTTGYRF